MSEELKAAQARIAELEGALSWHEEQRNDMAELRAELEHRNKLISDMQAAWDMALHTIGRQNAELAAIKAQEPVAEVKHGPLDSSGWPEFVRVKTIGDFDLENLPNGMKLYAAPVSDAKAQGVVQWPEADEIMQMAFEEGQPADDASGYCFELEEFDLFIERLMSEVARLNAAQAAPAADAGLDYQALFDAIAAATSVYANGAVNISVQAFRESLAAHSAEGVV